MAFQPTQETREIPGNVRDLQTVLFEGKEQTLTCVCTQLSQIYQGQNRHKEKVGEKNKEWQ